MPLQLHSTGRGSGISQDSQDSHGYTVFSGDWAVGHISQDRGGPEHLRWFWTLDGVLGKPPEMRASGYASSLDAAKAQFQASWQAWKAWAKLEEGR